MMLRYSLVLVAFFFLSQLNAQSSIKDYEYLVVPDQFEFTKGKDAFRLNTLTRYRLRQMGFNAVWENELPGDIARCDVAYVDAESSGGFINTKVNLHVRDCNGMGIFTSLTGTSKEKVYETAYREAFEEALASFLEAEESVAAVTVTPVREDMASTPSEAVVEKEIAIPKEIENPSNSTNDASELPKLAVDKSEVQEVYTFQQYQIKKKNNSYILTKEQKEIGTLVPMSQADMYLVSSSEFTGVARKTTVGFTVEAQLTGKDELSLMKFEK